jgi:type IV pilus assembly protein PilY1
MRRALAAMGALLASNGSALSQTCETSRPRESVTVEFSEGPSSQRVVFTPSDDGTLRAMNAADGSLLWTYRSKEATESPATGSRMTDVRVLRFDARSDGVIDIADGDRVWLYFGVRRAGTAYYALDVTDPSAARLLWRVGADELPGAGESWSTPTIARVKVGGEVQNGEHFVLVLGGGYDKQANTSGNRVFIVDAASGRLLWWASGEAGVGSADLELPSMRFPIPARATAVDTDGDAFADRLYAADLGGQVWRFDIWNGQARDSLVTGGVLASLGAAADTGVSTPTALPAGADARRFFNAPDVALIQSVGENPYYNIALGSGDAAALEDADAEKASAPDHDRFYSLRDRNAFTALSQSAYEATTPILDPDLVDITDAPFDSRVPPEAVGWKLDLRPTGTASGERVLAESITANGVILFTTFEASATGCAHDGAGRVYAVKVDTPQPALDLNGDGEITADDVSVPLSTPGVPASVRIALPPPASEDPTRPGSLPGGDEDPTQTENTHCRVGTETLAHCVPLRVLIRTFWRRHSTL